MSVTWMCGFEAGSSQSDGTSAATWTTGGIRRTGNGSFRSNAASGGAGELAQLTTGPGATDWEHFGFYVVALPSVRRNFCGYGGYGHSLALNSDGTISLMSSSSVLATSSSALSVGMWYWIGWRRATSGSSVVWLQVDGVAAITGTYTIGSTSTVLGVVGTEASALDVYFDDWVFDNAGFISNGKVNLALPISDSARATLWTGGSGGTTNLYDAVDNTPPVGTATESNTTQIEHAGGAAGSTDAYDANMTTYTNLGVGADDTVIALQYWIYCGEDISTGTKLLNFSLASNPTQASGLANFDVYPTSGALGTWPTAWTRKVNTIVASPTVTKENSPVMRVTRPETASRVASVCFMGMYVAWTPGVPPAGGMPYINGGYYP